ncbi:MAG TPA: hypothetical protein VGE27_06980 [Gemmatimonas sp.]
MYIDAWDTAVTLVRIDGSRNRIPSARALPPPHDVSAHEMDSCTSSDALLMNIACYPGAISGGLSTLLGVADGDVPHFGVAGAVPLADGSVDSTEVDMRIGDTNFEAKLTETSFTTKSLAAVERYADLDQVFVREAMPKADGDSRDASAYASYQLIRNVLAVARNPAARFVVLLDGRRPDLLHEWWRVYGAIRDADLRARCGFALWQELAAVAPAPLREFLATKYGL